MNRVSIIGIGWLGLQLAEFLNIAGFEVIGTVSSKEKEKALSKAFFSVEKYDISNPQIINSEALNFKKADNFVITIPPSATESYSERLIELIDELLKINPKSGLIFISSTSVYGNGNRDVTEKSLVNPQSVNAQKLTRVEKFLLNNYEANAVILRLGGLVGSNRHPVTALSGRNFISKPQSVVNLVHVFDVCSLIVKLLARDTRRGIFNLCCEEHPTKKEYYSWAADRLKIAKPLFNTVDIQKDKVVICDAIKKINFVMMFKSPFDFKLKK